MKDFYKMTPNELSQELERYTLQLIKQRDIEKIPLTENQKRRLYALRKAYKSVWSEYAK